MNNSYMYNYQSPRSTIRNLNSNNFLSMNKGKKVDVYLSFTNSKEWKDIILKGIIQDIGDDYLLLKDINNGKNTLIYTYYIDYIVFDE